MFITLNEILYNYFRIYMILNTLYLKHQFNTFDILFSTNYSFLGNTKFHFELKARLEMPKQLSSDTI